MGFYVRILISIISNPQSSILILCFVCCTPEKLYIFRVHVLREGVWVIWFGLEFLYNYGKLSTDLK